MNEKIKIYIDSVSYTIKLKDLPLIQKSCEIQGQELTLTKKK